MEQNTKANVSVQEFVQLIEQRAGLVFSPETVQRWIRTGKVRGARVGFRRWSIPASEVDRLISEMRADDIA